MNDAAPVALTSIEPGFFRHLTAPARVQIIIHRITAHEAEALDAQMNLIEARIDDDFGITGVGERVNFEQQRLDRAIAKIGYLRDMLNQHGGPGSTDQPAGDAPNQEGTQP